MTDATDEFITSETCSLAGTKREKTYRRARPKSSAERLEGTVFFGVFFFFLILFSGVHRKLTFIGKDMLMACVLSAVCIKMYMFIKCAIDCVIITFTGKELLKVQADLK